MRAQICGPPAPIIGRLGARTANRRALERVTAHPACIQGSSARRRVWRRQTSIVSIFVIVHGGFGGGWEWTPVSQLLQERGHVVFTPTLTGMGERSHLGPRVGLGTHIADVVAVLEFEDLHDVVLCGASYGGMAVTGAADRAPERVALVVYVDALVPVDGQSGVDLLPEWFGALVRAGADEHGHGWVAIPTRCCHPRVSSMTRSGRDLSLGFGISPWRRSPSRSIWPTPPPM